MNGKNKLVAECAETKSEHTVFKMILSPTIVQENAVLLKR